jgi:hypothetical protein
MPSNSCRIRFYGNLKDLTAPDRRESFEINYCGSPGVKDMIESCGIPHTEVGLLIVNGHPVEWKYRVKNRDEIAVYPFFKSIDITSCNRVIPADYPAGRFVVDVHLGRLCKYLRILGFDTSFNPLWNDQEIMAISRNEKRIILTRDRGILKNSNISFGCLIRSIKPQEQLRQVLDRYGLYDSINPLTRCLKCNGRIKSVQAGSVIEKVGENTKKYFKDFYQCSSCGRIYWKGSHFKRMTREIDSFLQNNKYDAIITA